MRTIVELIDKHGDDIEWDLLDRGVCLHDYFTGERPWPQLIRFVDKLEQGTLYHAALMVDEDVAQARLEHYIEEDRKRKPTDPEPVHEQSFVGYTREIEMLTTLVNAVWQNVFATSHMFGGGGGKPPQLPVPRSRFEALRDRYDNDYSDNLAARFGLA